MILNNYFWWRYVGEFLENLYEGEGMQRTVVGYTINGKNFLNKLLNFRQYDKTTSSPRAVLYNDV